MTHEVKLTRAQIRDWRDCDMSLESAALRRLTPAAVEIVQRMAAASRPARGADAQALDVLTAHVYALVAAAVATAPDDPERWQARLEAALLAAREVGHDVRETLRVLEQHRC